MRAVVAVVALVAGCGRIGFDSLAGDGGGSDDTGTPPGPSCFRGVAAGRTATCAIDARGDVWCWGANGERQSNPAVLSGFTLVPTKIALPAPAAQVRLGNQFACARLDDGRVFCWGNNDSGELGNNSLTDGGPDEIATTERAKEIAVASISGCMIRESDGGVMCWGAMSDGILGGPSRVPVAVPGITNMHGLAMAHRHGCALDAANAVWCWGRGRNGEIGLPIGDRATPMVTPSFGSQLALASGGKSTCALDASGAVRCLGLNEYGQLGDGTFTDRTSPASPAVTDAVELASGSIASCARRANGTVTCWGNGADGLLGDGAFETRHTAENANALLSSISIGYHHACGLTDDQILCWGRDTEGQLGRGSRAIARTPEVWGTPSTTQLFLSMGAFHACQVQAGVAQCWGGNADGQLGDGTRTTRRSAINVPLPFAPVGIAAGGKTTCAFASTDVACWGAGESGQIGDGALHGQPVLAPTTLGLIGTVALSLGDHHSCAVVGGAVQCWGSNASGQLGLAGFGQRASPTMVPNLTAPNRVAAGSAHTCAIHAPAGTNIATCWGANVHGQLGDGTKMTRSTPGTAVINLPSPPIEITAGREHSCAIVSGGAVYCWGRNDGTEVGVMNPADQATPQLVTLPAGAVSIAAGPRGTCASLSDGTAYCWGVGNNGELGNGTAPASSIPVQVTGLTTSRLVARSYNAACSALSNGQVACWGSSEGGQLGSGLRDDVATPMAVPLSCMP